jgi:hypothetical protein
MNCLQQLRKSGNLKNLPHGYDLKISRKLIHPRAMEGSKAKGIEPCAMKRKGAPSPSRTEGKGGATEMMERARQS